MIPIIAITGYSNAGKTTVIEKLVPELKKIAEKSENSALKTNAVEAVAKVAGHDQVSWLIKMAKKGDPTSVREAAVRALEPWATETPVYNCLVDVSKCDNASLAMLAKKIAVNANKKK